MAVLPFIAGNTIRSRSEEVALRVQRVPITQLEKIKGQLGLPRLPEELPDTREFGLNPTNAAIRSTEPANPNWSSG